MTREMGPKDINIYRMKSSFFRLACQEEWIAMTEQENTDMGRKKALTVIIFTSVLFAQRGGGWRLVSSQFAWYAVTKQLYRTVKLASYSLLSRRYYCTRERETATE